MSFIDKPVFEKIAAGDLVGSESDPFVVSLSAHANPSAITYIWTRDGLPLSSNTASSRIVARGSTLNITKLERNDAGTYICEAVNEEGSTFYELNLTVQCKPQFRRLIPNLCAIGISYTFIMDLFFC